MKYAGIKYLFIIALAALAVQACAKKDSALRARQAEAGKKEAPADPNAKGTGKDAGKDAGKDGGAGTGTGTGKDAGTGAGTGNGAGTGKDAGRDSKVEKNEDRIEGNGVDASLVYNEKGCDPLKVEVADEGEEKVTVEDLMRGGKTFKVTVGTYQLREMIYTDEMVPEKGTEQAANASTRSNSLPFVSTNNDVKKENNVIVTCHNVKKDASIKDRKFTMANEINLKDGSISVLRTDSITIEKDTITTSSKLEKKAETLKKLDVPVDGLEVVIVTQEGGIFTIRKQRTLPGSKVIGDVKFERKQTISATYELKK